MPDKNKLKKPVLIPLSRFARSGQYNAAYLSLLVQRKKLKAKKIGRNYYTTREWFDDYLVKHSRKLSQDRQKLKQPLTKIKRSFLARLFRVSFFVGENLGKAKAETARKLGVRSWVARLLTFVIFALALSVALVRFSPASADRIMAVADRVYLAPADKAYRAYASIKPFGFIGSYRLDVRRAEAGE